MRVKEWFIASVIFLGFFALVLALDAGAHTSNYHSTKSAIYSVFPAKYRAEAMAVVRCETGSTYNPRAISRNGLYYGIFQQGAWHRKTYGFAWNARTQALAGWMGFKANGYCWTCNRQWPHCGRGLDG